MKLRSTQVYLTEAEYAALQRAAERQGRSMTAVVRDLIEGHLMGSEVPPTDLVDLIGIVSTPEPTDDSQGPAALRGAPGRTTAISQ